MELGAKGEGRGHAPVGGARAAAALEHLGGYVPGVLGVGVRVRGGAGVRGRARGRVRVKGRGWCKGRG